jgi:hypothetical protein
VSENERDTERRERVGERAWKTERNYDSREKDRVKERERHTDEPLHMTYFVLN